MEWRSDFSVCGLWDVLFFSHSFGYPRFVFKTIVLAVDFLIPKAELLDMTGRRRLLDSMVCICHGAVVLGSFLCW